MKKKYLLLIVLFCVFLLPFKVFAAESYQQIFSTDEAGTLTTLDGLMTYDIGAGAKFTYYQFKFINTTLEKGKTYHVKINVFGTLSDGFYQFDKSAWEFSSYDAAVNKVDKLNAYDLKMTGSGQYRTIEFDFYNATDYRTYRLLAANPNGMLYYQYNGSGKFGWYSFNIEKINDSDDIIIAQNDLLIKNQQETNKKLDDLNKTNKDTQDFLKDDSDADTSGLADSAGWLPAGPVDSILNLPLAFLNGLNNSLSKTCQPAQFTLPFLKTNNTLTLPCMTTVYQKVGLSNWVTNTLGVIASGFILYAYLLNLYHWVDNQLTLRENTWNDTDQWGGI